MGRKVIWVILVVIAGVAAALFLWSEPDPAPTTRPETLTNIPKPVPQTDKAQEEIEPTESVDTEGGEPQQEELADAEPSPPDTLESEKTPPDTLVYDSLMPEAPVDTVLSTYAGSYANDDSGSVEQSELVGRLRLKALQTEKKEERVRDTVAMKLLEEQSRIKVGGEKTYTVEFWQTPFNSTGYKMGNLKLLIYGADFDRGAELYEYRDTFYLRNFNNFYQLRHSYKMQPLHTVDSTHAFIKMLKDKE